MRGNRADWAESWPMAAGWTQHPCWYKMVVLEPAPGLMADLCAAHYRCLSDVNLAER